MEKLKKYIFPAIAVTLVIIISVELISLFIYFYYDFHGARIMDEKDGILYLKGDLNFFTSMDYLGGNLGYNYFEYINIYFINQTYSYRISHDSGLASCFGYGPESCDGVCGKNIPFNLSLPGCTECIESCSKARSITYSEESPRIYNYLKEHYLPIQTMTFEFVYDKKTNLASNFSSEILDNLNISLNE